MEAKELMKRLVSSKKGYVVCKVWDDEDDDIEIENVTGIDLNPRGYPFLTKMGGYMHAEPVEPFYDIKITIEGKQGYGKTTILNAIKPVIKKLDIQAKNIVFEETNAGY